MPVDNQINAISTMMCSMIGFMVVAVDSIKDGFASGYMGSKGLLTAFLVAFFTANLYKFFIKRNITVKMPDAVHQIFHRHLKMLFHLEYVYCY